MNWINALSYCLTVYSLCSSGSLSVCGSLCWNVQFTAEHCSAAFYLLQYSKLVLLLFFLTGKHNKGSISQFLC